MPGNDGVSPAAPPGAEGGTVPDGGPVAGADGRFRTPWALTHPLLLEYYDTEWGQPVYGEQELFERLSLEAFQAGLSWLTILKKRQAFRAAFHNFDPDRVARLTEEDMERLLQDSGIIRNRQKIEATRKNALATIDLRQDGGLSRFIWSYKPRATPRPARQSEVPTASPESLALSKALRKRGFTFVGPTTMYALMEAVGMVDTHLVGSHRRGAAGIWPD